MNLTFTIPPESWLTSNRHGIHRGQRARIVRELHGVAILTVRCAGAKPLAGPVAAHWTVRYPKGVSRSKGDASNAQPTTKALLDGLVLAGLLEDDGPLHVTSETFTRGPNLDRPRDHEIALTLISQEVPF
jgi:hypothetical protein